MPIKGVSDVRRFMRLGKIRLGKKETSQRGTQYPTKVDYFIIDPYDPALLPRIKELYGEKPRRLMVALPDEDPDRVFDQNYECWGASQLHCRGDGETAQRMDDKGARSAVACPGPESCEFALSRGMRLKEGGVKPGCQRVARLQVVLTDLDGFGVWQIDTGSFNSIVNVNSALDMLRRIAGRISWIEIPLTITPQKVTVPDTGKQSTIYVLNLPLPVSVKNFVPLQPLIELATERRIERLEGPQGDMPTDLIPASRQIAGPAGPDAEESVDPETGECADDGAGENPEDPHGTEDAAPFDETQEPEAPSLADDPEVLAAFDAAGCSPAKRAALLASAQADNWPKDQLLAVVAKSGQAPRPAPTAPRPAPTTPAKRPGNLF